MCSAPRHAAPVTTALPFAERAQLFAQLAALERAGVPLLSALAGLQLGPASRARVQRLSRWLEDGRELAGAGCQAGLFTPLEASLIRAAQSAGSPARLFERLADSHARRAAQGAALRARLLLPGGVLLLALLIQPLPALIGGSLGPFAYFWGVLQPLVLLAALWLLGRQLWRRQQASTRPGAWPGRLPLLGRALRRRNVRDFFESLGLLLEAGVPMFEALPKALATLDDAELRRAFAGLQVRLQAGQTLAQALQLLDFPGKTQLAALVCSAEAGGALPATLLSYAARESAALEDFQQQLAVWLPRLIYLLVALWMAYGLLGGPGVAPRLPAGLGAVHR
ncbi:type II secretion system F family protein [Pseudomonas sp. CAU 1711]|uniref:type II secretion system F family protein n=1 Tax=Pseudomonas sp. CAU 1711 TaxID=3140356 RepID=UPI003260BAE0